MQVSHDCGSDLSVAARAQETTRWQGTGIPGHSEGIPVLFSYPSLLGFLPFPHHSEVRVQESSSL